MKTIKEELEEYLGHSITDEFYTACINAFKNGRHGPAGLGGAAVLGYYVPFESVLGHNLCYKNHSGWPCEEAIHLGIFFHKNEERRNKIRELLAKEQQS